AAALAIVTRQRGDPAREEAMRRVETGAPLYAVARALELPFWYRRLPPEAFASAPVKVPQGLCDDSSFGAQILNLLPGVPAALCRWLEAVNTARAVGGDTFALWIGRQKALQSPQSWSLPVAVLALYAWHSQHGERQTALPIGVRWHPGMSLARAAEEA